MLSLCVYVFTSICLFLVYINMHIVIYIYMDVFMVVYICLSLSLVELTDKNFL